MSSITYWNRLEPRSRTGDLIQPLQARVRDPLWMLTRQWQLGEFLGVDSGSPAWVTLSERLGAMTGLLRPDGTVMPLTAAPLEHQIEREPFTPDLATRIELGRVLSRLLGNAGTADTAFRTTYPVSATIVDAADPVEATLRRVCAGRAIDGVAAYVAIKAGDASVPTAPTTALAAFVAWVESTLGSIGGAAQDASAWQPAHLEYAAAVAATTEAGNATLDVSPGDDGLIDWAAFDLASTTAGAPLTATTRTLIPAHVRFKGMPNARFWDFENGTVDFGDVKPDKRDLARLALIDFMLVHANDWFMLPVEVPLGGIYQLDTLIVHDVFGVETLIQRADREALGSGSWTMFSTSLRDKAGAAAEFFVMPPSAGSALMSGRVLEEIRFARDEMANMAWAIENVLENAAGEPWPQHEREAAVIPAAAPPAATDAAVPLRYQIESRVPASWIPLLPVSLDPLTGSVALELASAIAADGHTRILPRGRILKPTSVPAGQPYQLPEQTVSRNGLRVQRVTARSRWIDGSTRIWQLRRIQPGAGETSSALRFDQALPR
jgi:hypothetical protein